MVVTLYCLGRNDKKNVSFLFSTDEVLFPEYFLICGWLNLWIEHDHIMNVDDQMPFVVCWEGLTTVQVQCLVCGPWFKYPGCLCWQRRLWPPVTDGCVFPCSMLPDTKDRMSMVVLDVGRWLAYSVWWWHGGLSCVALSCRVVTDQGRCHSDLEVLDASLWDWWRSRPEGMKVSMT